jgi:two-component system phosphate regulon response regulator PhoB
MNGNVKVLVVENEMPVAMMVVSVLTRIGFTVQVATKARKGLEIAQEQKFDLILLETNSPAISGLKLCAELRQRHISYRTPIICVSAQCGDEYREQALENGAVDDITKPLRASEFVPRILSYVRQAEEVSASD